MKLKLSATLVTLALISACGGGGDSSVDQQQVNNVEIDSRDGETPTSAIMSEDRTQPAAGVYMSANFPVKANDSDLHSDFGNPPQVVNSGRVGSWPGLRYGNFYVSNNPWNASAALYPSWYQQISLYESGTGYGVGFDWDWGAEQDTSGSTFNTKSYPEVIYGTKSAAERSGTYQETGLPVEIYNSPSFTIDYSYTYEGRPSVSSNSGTSEFNIAIESFYHSECDIKRTGNAVTDNTVFETMVWLKMGDRKPSGDAPRGVVTTSDGRSYDVYTKLASNSEYIAFVAKEEQLSGSVKYSELLRHAQDNAGQYGIYALKDTDCLANILMGTEIWHGAGTFRLDSYQVNRTY